MGVDILKFTANHVECQSVHKSNFRQVMLFTGLRTGKHIYWKLFVLQNAGMLLVQFLVEVGGLKNERGTHHRDI